jgi:O-antigen ligase
MGIPGALLLIALVVFAFRQGMKASSPEDGGGSAATAAIRRCDGVIEND